MRDNTRIEVTVLIFTLQMTRDAEDN